MLTTYLYGEFINKGEKSEGGTLVRDIIDPVNVAAERNAGAWR